ncbi:MAG: peroxiredoxin [gamma proteobacterium symbiont of Bathyaustriella thionipta]|nr:peroxiredoxin [gamma proteobacterium symbiont of Bathyaustriella thionipta]
MLKEGDKAPLLTLPDADMNRVDMAEIVGKSLVVLFFYPRDDTPGCTLEATEFSDLMERFEAADTRLLGVSRDTCVSHGAFRDKFGLTMTLLADVEAELCRAYGVLQTRERNGVSREVLLRSTFIINKQGVIEYALYDVSPGEHAELVLGLVQRL